jgi:zinc protease
MQPKGEPEMSMKQLQETYNGIMSPAPAVVSEEVKPTDTAPAPETSAQ